jgi:hypothetical protein
MPLPCRLLKRDWTFLQDEILAFPFDEIGPHVGAEVLREFEGDAPAKRVRSDQVKRRTGALPGPPIADG